MRAKNKSRSFSIYLLKPEYNATNTLKDEHGLQLEKAANLPPEASLYILDSIPRSPWWREYFGIAKELKQASKGSLIFLPVKDRWFALSFGHVYHHMKDMAYEYDFGLRVTLNALDPERLISADTLEPSVARRQRTQTPKESDLTYFDFDRDSSIIKSLTGKVREEYKDLIKHVTGSSNLRISSSIQPDELIKICEKLLEIYSSDAYRTNFPDLQNIMPVKDPVDIVQLNGKMLAEFYAKNNDLCLTVPAMVNYSDNIYSQFSGRSAVRYEDVDMQNYYDHLLNCGIDYRTMSIETLQGHQLILVDEDGAKKDSYSVYRSLIFAAELNGDNYHLCDGSWYKVESSYMAKIQSFLDPRYEEHDLIPYNHDTEGAYNTAVANNNNVFICLDQTSISPSGQTAIEPCDLYAVSGD